MSGCYKESLDKMRRIRGLKWTGTYAVPAINMDIGMDDAVDLASSFANAGAYTDKMIYLAYEKTISSKTGTELVPLGNQNFNFNDQLNAGEQTTLLNANSVQVDRQYGATYVHADEIDSVNYKSGSLNISFSNQYDHQVVVRIILPDLTFNGQIKTLNDTLNPRATGNYTVPLAGGRLRLTAGGAGFNHFRCHSELKYLKSGTSISTSDNYNISLNFISQNFSRVWGYFGSKTLINGSDSVDMGLFGSKSKVNLNNLFFENPSLKVFYENSTGIPFSVTTSNVRGIKTGFSPVAVTGFPETVAVGAAGSNPFLDSTVKNSGNSNFKTMINSMAPPFIPFDVKADANPAGKIQRNWVDADSKLDVKVWAELPFNGWAGRVEATDTSDMNVQLDGAEDYIDWISFRIEIENGIALDAEFQGYFADSAGNILDSIMKPYRSFAKAATVDANGDVIQPSYDVYHITFEKDRIKNIMYTRKFILHVIMSSAKFNSSTIPVKITSEQRFKMKMGVHTQLSANEKI